MINIDYLFLPLIMGETENIRHHFYALSKEKFIFRGFLKS